MSRPAFVRFEPLLKGTIAALWFAIIPGLLAALTYRYGVPSEHSAVVGVLGELGSLCRARPALSLLALFVLYAAMLRYWGPRLYGSALWLRSEAQSESVTAGRRLSAWSLALVVPAMLAFGIRASVAQPFKVLSASMLPTLAPGQVLLANRSAYGLRLPFLGSRTPQLPARGDVVVFDKQLGQGKPHELVKRVVGLPGDTVIVRAGQLWINGWAVPMCDAGRYAYLSGSGMLDARLVVEFLDERPYLTAFFAAPDYGQEPYVVKPGEVFVLGDNRSNSSDSRFWNDGHGAGLPVTAISGRFDRRLVGQKRDGSPDFSDFLAPLGLDVKLEGMDASDLERGIERCLARKPAITTPPKPFATPKATP